MDLLSAGRPGAALALTALSCQVYPPDWRSWRRRSRRSTEVRRLIVVSDRSLTHLDPLGGARMVDVTPREPTHRRALARCRVTMLPETTTKVANNAITKGDVLAAARIAGIQAAKRTADLIPMCHPVLVGSVGVNSRSATTTSRSRPRSRRSTAPGSRWRR